MSALPPKADMDQRGRNVRFVPSRPSAMQQRERDSIISSGDRCGTSRSNLFEF